MTTHKPIFYKTRVLKTTEYTSTPIIVNGKIVGYQRTIVTKEMNPTKMH